MDSLEVTEWMAEFSLRNEEMRQVQEKAKQPPPQGKQEMKMVLGSMTRKPKGRR